MNRVETETTSLATGGESGRDEAVDSVLSAALPAALHDWLNQIVNGSPVPTLAIDANHVVRNWNKALEILSGVPAEAIIGTTNGWSAFYPEPRPILADLIVDASADQDLATYYPGKYRKSDLLPNAWEVTDFFPSFTGGGRWLTFTAAPLFDDHGTLIGGIEILRDITSEKIAAQMQSDTQHLLQEIVDGCPVPMFVVGADHRITHWNRASAAVIGAKSADMIGTRDQWKPFYPNPRRVMADLVIDQMTEDEVAALYGGKFTKSELIPGAWEGRDFFPHFGADGRWLYFTAAPLHGHDGAIIGAVETLQDITSQKAYERQLEHQANHDALTGLANRALLHDRIAQAIAHAKRQSSLVAVLFIDLDHFKVINDSLGHGAGDQVIIETARRLQALIREGDTVARIGGDEFVVLLFNPQSDAVIADIMQRLIADISRPIQVGQDLLTVGCSIGAALYPRDGHDLSHLMKNADAAMYRAKELGRCTFSFFTRELNDQANTRLSLERDLHHALERRELVLHYQPQVSLATGRIVGAEALLRWQHPRLGLLAPKDFIPLAEETGQISEIGNWVLHTAISDASVWPIVDPSTQFHLSINLSPRQFRRTHLIDDLEKLLVDYGRPHITLELELTESMVMHDAQEAAGTMMRMKAMGIHLAMDDFGTGYSSLGYLRAFPFDMIKIDRSFVAELGQGLGAEAIVRAIVALADSFGLGIIAEGIETLEQSILLAQEGCRLAQGFYFSRPVPEAEFLQLLAKRQSTDALAH